MNVLGNRKWWGYAGTRALKTAVQVAIALVGVSALLSDVNWVQVASTAALSAVLSFLTSLAGLPEMDNPATPENEAGQ